MIVAQKKHFVYLGCSGFPFGLAEVQKMSMISKSLIKAGNEVTIISNWSAHRKKDHPELTATGTFEGINFIYTTGNPFQSDNLFRRKLMKFKGLVNEFVLLKKMKRQGELNYAILSTHSFYAVLYYTLLGKMFGFKTILNYVEYYSGIRGKWFEPARWINNKLYDDVGPRLVDAVFPISEFLIQHVEKVAPGKKYLKVPVLTNFERYDDCEVKQDQKYFLFCGAANYIEIVKFIIDSFVQLDHSDVFLYLVVNGYDHYIQEIKNYIGNTTHSDRIKLMSKLTNKQLNDQYKNAMALLIPLRPAFQDIARFPHKIGEYLASGNPVISTNYGEVAHYFKNMEQMLIAESYETKLFAEKMQFVIDNPCEVKKIGIQGRTMALVNFDYNVYGKKIIHFLDQMNGQHKK